MKVYIYCKRNYQSIKKKLNFPHNHIHFVSWVYFTQFTIHIYSIYILRDEGMSRLQRQINFASKNMQLRLRFFQLQKNHAQNESRQNCLLRLAWMIAAARPLVSEKAPTRCTSSRPSYLHIILISLYIHISTFVLGIIMNQK